MDKKEAKPRHIEALARELRKEFAIRKGGVLGKVYKPSKRHDKFEYWKKAAEQCYTLSAKPEDYVAAAFEQCKLASGPFPNNMAGRAAIGWWRGYVNNRPYLKTVQEMERESGTKCLDSQFPSGQELELGQDIKHVRELLVDTCGTWQLTAQTLQKLRSLAFPIDSYLRVLLTWTVAGGDDIVIERYGKDALEFFERRPNVISAARMLGFPMNDIIERLQRNEQ